MQASSREGFAQQRASEDHYSASFSGEFMHLPAVALSLRPSKTLATLLRCIAGDTSVQHVYRQRNLSVTLNSVSSHLSQDSTTENVLFLPLMSYNPSRKLKCAIFRPHMSKQR